MILKKQFESSSIHFEILGDKVSLDKKDVLENIVNSLNGIKLINRDKPFNELMKEQKKHPKHILVEFEPKQFDEFKLITKAIHNFLIETDQAKYFMLEDVTVSNIDDEIIIFGTEILREDLSGNTTFSPMVRAHWITPDLIERIIKRQ